ncbi:MAG: hydrogenase maturation protease [Gallionellaceae bacterium]|nr:hydrogenase maturation protease [Gallionellaceae bacterium]
MQKILILGLGNTLLSDEGVGVHVVQALAAAPVDDGVELLDGGTLGFVLAGPVAEAAALVVVDAAQLHEAPGTVRVFKDAEMDSFLAGTRKGSVHEVGLIDLMGIARLTDTWPARRALVAIQPGRVDWGEAASAPVAAAVPLACGHIRSLLREWRHGAA